MKLNIEWKSKIEVFDAVGTIETYSDKRDDILELLKYINENGANKEGLLDLFGNKEISPIVVIRVLEYLRECGYITNDTLTIKGKRVLESGKVAVEQRGKFRFWNIENLGPMKDMYSNGSKLIIGYKREKDIKKAYIHRENAENYKKLKVSMPNSNEEFRVVSLSENQHTGNGFACIKQLNQNKNIELKLSLDSSNKINLIVNGDFREFGDNNIKTKSNTIFSEDNSENEMSQYIINLLNQCDLFDGYNLKTNSFKVKNLKQMINNRIIKSSDLENFKSDVIINNFPINEEIYDIKGEDIPIMPSNKEDAEFWFSRVVENKVEDNYINNDEFNNLLNDISNKVQFENFIDGNNIDKSKYITSFKKDNKLRAYWNLQAPRDLMFDLNNKFILDRIDVQIGSEMSIQEIINRLVGNNKVEKLMFSSKYIIKPEQKKKFEVFVEALRYKGCQNVNLVTQNKFSLKGVEVKSYEEVYGSRKNWPHDRYFSLKIDGIWHYYKMSAELDQCKYEEENLEKWSPELVGKWKDISFDKVDRSIFPLELLKIEDNL